MNIIFKKIWVVSTLTVALLVVVLMMGLYPAARVGDSFIWKRTWQKAEEAEKKLTNTQAKSLNLKPVNFSIAENKDLLTGIKQDTLTSLIEDMIIQQDGIKIVQNLAELSKKRMQDTIQGGGQDLDKAVRTVYNLSLEDFRNLVLLPQARRDVLRVFLASEGKNFEEWLKSEKQKKNVKLFLVPFRWDGERVK